LKNAVGEPAYPTKTLRTPKFYPPMDLMIRSKTALYSASRFFGGFAVDVVLILIGNHSESQSQQASLNPWDSNQPHRHNARHANPYVTGHLAAWSSHQKSGESPEKQS